MKKNRYVYKSKIFLSRPTLNLTT